MWFANTCKPCQARSCRTTSPKPTPQLYAPTPPPHLPQRSKTSFHQKYERTIQLKWDKCSERTDIQRFSRRQQPWSDIRPRTLHITVHHTNQHTESNTGTDTTQGTQAPHETSEAREATPPLTSQYGITDASRILPPLPKRIWGHAKTAAILHSRLPPLI